MDLDEFRSLYQSAGVDIWTVIDMALTVASIDFCKELKVRRDHITERLFARTTTQCLNCDTEGARQSASKIKRKPKSTLAMEKESNEDEDSHEGETHNFPPHTPYNDENEEFAEEKLNENQGNYIVKEICRIKLLLEDSDQPHNALLEALQALDSMDISVESLKETDIGRHVNALRKHLSAEVRKLVKQLIRKWKDLVDEWVNTAGEVAAAAIVDGNSPQAGGIRNCEPSSVQKSQISSNCGSSVLIKDGSFSAHKPSMESDSKHKGVNQGSANSVNNAKTSDFSSCESPQLISGDVQTSKNQMKQDASLSQKSNFNVSPSERLASARKRLQEKYQEAENAKRQRTVQMMDLQDLPKPRNTFISHGNQHKSKHRFYGK